MMTVSPNIELAPGCFAVPLIYKATAKECAECIFGSQCGPKAAARLAVLHEHYGIKPKVASDRASPAKTESGLPTKVEELVAKIQGTGIDIGRLLREKHNPFKTKPAFLKLACHLLLAIPAGISRENLRYSFQSKLNWTEGTAAAHVLQTVQALVALGAAEEFNGRLIIKRNQ